MLFRQVTIKYKDCADLEAAREWSRFLARLCQVFALHLEPDRRHTWAGWGIHGVYIQLDGFPPGSASACTTGICLRPSLRGWQGTDPIGPVVRWSNVVQKLLNPTPNSGRTDLDGRVRFLGNSNRLLPTCRTRKRAAEGCPLWRLGSDAHHLRSVAHTLRCLVTQWTSQVTPAKVSAVLATNCDVISVNVRRLNRLDRYGRHQRVVDAFV